MLSILIPIYNESPIHLINSIAHQCIQLNIAYEMRCYDDASPHHTDLIPEIDSSFNFIFKRLDSNIGRARIRNLLAQDAQYEYLLYLDGDSEIIGDDFIESYLNHLHPKKIIIGGRQYPKHTPGTEYTLHWLYGSNRESRPLSTRQSNPYLYFHTNNFVVHKNILLQNKFDDTVSGYGYEDLLWGKQLHDLNINIQHIDNPIIHSKLDNSKQFLNKTIEGIDNLVKLNQTHNLQTKLTETVSKYNSFGLGLIIKSIYWILGNKIIYNLQSKQPNLLLFDIFRLYHYIKKKEEQHH